ncbi:GlxA family transcriptional regulator [Thalassolituus sp. LLYu03]|uniref:GlxA family transcriptional regulator n=1 Tax=Thalassolituus sp. LLYu03 TaxID=3421656 RepID=UPI003D2AA6FA
MQKANTANIRADNDGVTMNVRIDLLHCPQALDGFLLSTIDILRSANLLWQLRNPRSRGALFHWRCINAQGDELPLPAWLGGLASPAEPQKALPPSRTALIVPALVMRNVPDLERLLGQLQAEANCIARYHAQGRLVAAAFNGAALLAQAGVLNGRRATISWTITKWFADRFPQVQLVGEGPVVIDGTVLTTGAPVSQYDLMVELVRSFAGDELAQTLSNVLSYDPKRFDYANLMFPSVNVTTRDSVVFKAKQWIRRNIQTPYELDRVAQEAAVSPRTLLRHFKEVEGRTPLDYLHKLRVERAKQLLEVTLIDLEEITEYCGYRDSSAFRRVFRRATGLTPSEYRSKYTLRTSGRWWRAEENGEQEDLIAELGLSPDGRR